MQFLLAPRSQPEVSKEKENSKDDPDAARPMLLRQVQRSYSLLTGQSVNREVSAVFEPEFPQKIADMEFCGAFANVQLARNLFVCEMPERSWNT